MATKQLADRDFSSSRIRNVQSPVNGDEPALQSEMAVPATSIFYGVYPDPRTQTGFVKALAFYESFNDSTWTWLPYQFAPNSESGGTSPVAEYTIIPAASNKVFVSKKIAIASAGGTPPTFSYRGFYRGSGYAAPLSSRVYSGWFYASQLSNATDNYTVRLGPRGYPGTDDDTRIGMYFKYNHAINSGQWQCVCNGGSTTTANTSVAVAAATWYYLAVERTSANTVKYYINGTLVATNSTNVPTTSAMQSEWFYYTVARNAGTSVFNLYLAGESIYLIP